jgi:hypothetical protein
MVSGNVITKDGWNTLINRTFKTVPDYTIPTTLKIGQDKTTTPALATTALDKYVPISAIGLELVDACSSASWTEAADAGAETTNTTTYKIGADQTDNTSLNLSKTGTASVNATYSKATTSRDGTGKTLLVWTYFSSTSADAYDKLATTAAITIRFGSDSSNYYQWTFNKSVLATGWNLLSCPISTGAVTGSPVVAALDYSYINLATAVAASTITLGKWIMDLWCLADSTDYTRTLTSGYPVFDETNNEVTLRWTVYSNEATGYLMNGLWIGNTDATPKSFNVIALTTGESKSDTDEFIIETRYRRNG